MPETYDFTRKHLLLIFATLLLFSDFSHFFAFVFIYIFLFNLSFFACLSVLLVFFFRCVPLRDAVRILCRIPESSTGMG